MAENKSVRSSGRSKLPKKNKKQPELPAMPKQDLKHLDPAQRAAVKILEAQDLIGEGKQMKKDAENNLSDVLSNMARDRVCVMGKKFTLVHQESKVKVKITDFKKEDK